jgi:hypothetical protein
MPAVAKKPPARRRLLVALAVIVAGGLAVLGAGMLSPAPRPEPAAMTMYMSPACPCCEVYADYLRDNGFAVRIVRTEDLDAVRSRLGVPEGVRSCHTTTVGDYFVEGHVPVEAIHRLLGEGPEIAGIALPGMPAGSPGMPGLKEGPFTIYAVAGGQVIGVFVRV